MTQPDGPIAWYYSGKLGEIPLWRTPSIPPTDGMAIVKAATYIHVPHELLVDNDPSHVCGPDCPPEPSPTPPLPRSTRVRYALRRARWRVARLGGLRLVHKDRIDQDADE